MPSSLLPGRSRAAGRRSNPGDPEPLSPPWPPWCRHTTSGRFPTSVFPPRGGRAFEAQSGRSPPPPRLDAGSPWSSPACVKPTVGCASPRWSLRWPERRRRSPAAPASRRRASPLFLPAALRGRKGMNLPRGPARQRPGGWAPPFMWRRVWPRPPPPRGGALPGGRLRRGQAPMHAAELMGRPSCCAATLRPARKGITPLFPFIFCFQ